MTAQERTTTRERVVDRTRKLGEQTAFYGSALASTADAVGPDGRRHTQSELAHPQNKTWQSMLVPPQGG